MSAMYFSMASSVSSVCPRIVSWRRTCSGDITPQTGIQPYVIFIGAHCAPHICCAISFTRHSTFELFAALLMDAVFGVCVVDSTLEAPSALLPSDTLTEVLSLATLSILPSRQPSINIVSGAAVFADCFSSLSVKPWLSLLVDNTSSLSESEA